MKGKLCGAPDEIELSTITALCITENNLFYFYLMFLITGDKEDEGEHEERTEAALLLRHCKL